jgi:F-type H+-transporting ATPase subunit beta
MVNQGAVVSARGGVVDVQFERTLPPVYRVLRTGAKRQIVIEVLEQMDARRIRGIALTPTQGFARGMSVEDKGQTPQVPIGKGIVSRMFNVFGRTIDPGPAPADVTSRDLHRDPPPFEDRSTKSELFEIGIKAIDVLVPLERGAKDGLLGGPGVATTLLLTEMIHNTR